MSESNGLTIFNINKKDEHGEYIWSLRNIWRYNEKKKAEKKPKQVILRCGYFDDGHCITRGCITFNNLSRHVLDYHCDGDEGIFEERYKDNIQHYEVKINI